MAVDIKPMQIGQDLEPPPPPCAQPWQIVPDWTKLNLTWQTFSKLYNPYKAIEDWKIISVLFFLSKREIKSAQVPRNESVL